jgi:periplasmic copper chaperone A
MRTLRFTSVALVALLLTSFGAVAQSGPGHSTPQAGQHGHAHGTPHPGHDTDPHGQSVSLGAFYFTLTNNGEETDRLIDVQTDIAGLAEIHDVMINNGVMQMMPMLDGVEIAAGETIAFEPGGFHVMLIGLTESLLDGGEFRATLYFEHAGEIEITVPIYMSEPDDNAFADPVHGGHDDSIEVSNVWARQAPKLDGMATPMATPDVTPSN